MMEPKLVPSGNYAHGPGGIKIPLYKPESAVAYDEEANTFKAEQSGLDVALVRWAEAFNTWWQWAQRTSFAQSMTMELYQASCDLAEQVQAKRMK